MKIGIDFGGIIEFDIMGFQKAIANLIKADHSVYIISHALANEDHKRRSQFALTCGAIDKTFSDIPPSHESAIELRKASIVKENNIDIFIEDYMNRIIAVQKINPNCTCIYSPIDRWERTLELLNALAV